MFLSFNVSGLFAVVSMLYPPRRHYNYSIALSTLTTALQYKVASLSPSKSGVTTEHVPGKPFITAVPFWGRTSQILSSLSPKRDAVLKGLPGWKTSTDTGCGRVGKFFIRSGFQSRFRDKPVKFQVVRPKTGLRPKRVNVTYTHVAPQWNSDLPYKQNTHPLLPLASSRFYRSWSGMNTSSKQVTSRRKNSHRFSNQVSTRGKASCH